MSTYSNLKIELIGTGEQDGTWGDTTNLNLGTALEEAIVGTVDQAVTASDLTLSLTDTNATQVARHLRLNLTGSSGGSSNLVVPTLANGKNYYIKNSSTTAITVKTATGTGILVPAGKSASLYQDGTNVVEAADYSSAAYTFASDITVNGVTVGKGLASGSLNTALGVNAMNAITSGNANTGLGNEALGAATTGGNNTAVGNFSLGAAILTGSENTSVGSSALRNTTTGSNNAAHGANALFSNISGNSNSALGYAALQNHTTGSNNVGLGREALGANTTASNNTAVGYQALYSNTGDRNIAIGSTALYAATTGQGSIAIGYQALKTASTGDDNVAIGSDSPTSNAALENLTTGIKNVSVGNNSGVGVTTAGFNTFLGFGAGEQGNKEESVLIGYNAGRLVTANQSTFVGSESGKNITTGAKNTILGRFNGNQGGLDIRTSSNNIVLSDGDGNPAYHVNSSGIHHAYRPTGISGNSCFTVKSNVGGTRTKVFEVTGDGDTFNVNNTFGALSDQTLKENIADASSQWDDLKAIQVRKYSMISDNLDAANRLGVIAQELETSGMNGLVKENEEGIKSVKYSILYMKAVKALQEAMTRIETLETKVTALEG